GRNATPVETDAAEVIALNDRRLETQLSRSDRGHIAAGTGADDDNVEACISHGRRCSCRQAWPALAMLSHSTGFAAFAQSGWCGLGEASSGVTARAQILIEQRVVAVNIALVFGGQLLASARGLDLGLSALAIEGVELRPDRAAGLSRRQRRCPRIAAEIVALRAPGERGKGRHRGHR